MSVRRAVESRRPLQCSPSHGRCLPAPEPVIRCVGASPEL